MAAAQVVPIRTLYELEDDLMAMLESMDTVTPDQEQEFLADFGRALQTAKDKRDSVARYMAHCESQIELAKAEIERLRERKLAFECSLDRIKSYVVYTMESLGTKKLEGSCVTLSLRKCPAAVEVLDEGKVPVEFKTATFSLPGPLVDKVLDALAIDDPVRLAWNLDKRAIKAALDAGDAVPGAGFAPEKHTIARR